MHLEGVLSVAIIWSKFLWSIKSIPPGRIHFLKLCMAVFCSRWSPKMSCRRANEFPRQMTASNPSLICGIMSLYSVNQFASSITNVWESYLSISILFSQSRFCTHAPQLLNEGSDCRFQRSFLAYMSILADASTETTSKFSSSNIIESTLERY